MPYERFVKTLDPYLQETLRLAVQYYLQREGPNVCAGEWGKNLGRGLYEFRIRRDLQTICSQQGIAMPDSLKPRAKVLLRVFFTTYGRSVVLLLSGYDKGRSPTGKSQNDAIKRARSLLKAFKAEQRQVR